MPGKCLFQTKWMEKVEWSKWLRPSESDKHVARCLVCLKTFDIGCSGEASVKIHAKGKKHIQLCVPLNSGMQTTLNLTPQVPTPPNLPSTSVVTGIENSEVCVNKEVLPESASKNLKSFLISDEVTKAEILWALNKVMCHNSDRSSANTSNLFPLMFHDSVIAQKFSMHKDKTGYVITYGLGPYFQDDLVQVLKNCKYFSISFDESLNSIAQKSQMDIVVRYWNSSSNEASTRYLTSSFMGHATAQDLLNSFTMSLSELGVSIRNINQVCMDGPNINLKFLREFQLLLKNERHIMEDNPELFDIGTCSLHIVHGAYKTAHDKSKWKIHEFLRSIYYLFKNFPSRRADYQHFSGSNVFPQKFCSVRWVENGDVLQRGLKVLPCLKKYVAGVKNNPPDSKNFVKVKDFLQQDMLSARLAFLQSIATELEPFLMQYQSNEPELPFMFKDLYNMLRSVMSRFIKGDVMITVTNSSKLMAVDVKQKNNQKTAHHIDIGFGAIHECRGKKDVDLLTFRNESKEIMLNLFVKLIKMCPLTKNIVKGASCLSPDIMLSKTLRNSRVELVLQEFVLKKQMAPSVADSVKRDYLMFCDNSEVQNELKKFDRKNCRLDTFLMKIMNDFNIDSTKMIDLFQQILTLFHGNAAVERSFSINKECLLENLSENSLVAQRSVHGAVMAAGNIENIVITKPMILQVRNASARRRTALDKKRTELEEKHNEEKRNAKQLKELECKKKRLMEQATEEVDAVDEEIEKLRKKLRIR